MSDAKNIREMKVRGEEDLPVRKEIAFGETIRKYRLMAKIDQDELARVCGITANTVSNWERGRSRPDLSQIPALCARLNLPLSVFFDLPRGEGLSVEEKEMIRTYRKLTEGNRLQAKRIMGVILDCQEETRRAELRKNFRMLTGHECGLSAGFGIALDEEPGTFPFFVRKRGSALRADDVFPVNGQSMAPDYPDGSRVYVKRVRNEEISFGDIIACVVGGTPFVKIYERDGLHSINPAYATITVTEDEPFRLVGRVLGPVLPEDLPTPEETEFLMSMFGAELF